MLENEESQEEEKVSIYTIILRVGSIEAGPPLSTILGNHGINTVNFVKELNEHLIDVPNYFFLRIKITIFSSNTSRYIFEVFEPSLFQCIRVLSYKKTLRKFVGGKFEDFILLVINLEDFYSACYIKYGYIDESLLKMAYSIVKSSNIKIYDDDSEDEENEDENEDEDEDEDEDESNNDDF